MNRSVSLTLTADDYVAANQLHALYGYRRRYVVAVVAFVVVAYIAVVAIAYLDRSTNAIIGVSAIVAAWPVLWAVSYFLLVPMFTRRTYRNHKSLQHPYTYSWSETGLAVANSNGEWRVPWSDYLKWRENTKVMVFYQAPRLFNMIPKRVLTPEQVVDLRQCAGRIVE
jgi:hypothetical protein